MSQVLQIFDLDSTLLTGDSSRSWCQYLVDQHIVADPQLFLDREAEFNQAYYNTTIKVEEYIDFVVSSMNHIPYSKLCQILDTYIANVVKPMCCKEGLDIIARCNKENIPCLVISASAAYLVKRAAALFGIPAENVLSVEVAVDLEHDKLLPQIVGVPSFQDGKITRLHMWLDAHKISDPEIYFYTDSINDLPLCLEAQHVFAINPSKAMQEEAQRRNWPQEKWHAIGTNN